MFAAHQIQPKVLATVSLQLPTLEPEPLDAQDFWVIVKLRSDITDYQVLL